MEEVFKCGTPNFSTRIRVFHTFPELKTRLPSPRESIRAAIALSQSARSAHSCPVGTHKAFRQRFAGRSPTVFDKTQRHSKNESLLSAALFPLEETNAVSGTVWTRSKFAVARLSDILHGNYRYKYRNLPLHRTSSLGSLPYFFYVCNRFFTFYL